MDAATIPATARYQTDYPVKKHASACFFLLLNNNHTIIPAIFKIHLDQKDIKIRPVVLSASIHYAGYYLLNIQKYVH